MYTTFCLSISPVDGHLGCFHVITFWSDLYCPQSQFPFYCKAAQPEVWATLGHTNLSKAVLASIQMGHTVQHSCIDNPTVIVLRDHLSCHGAPTVNPHVLYPFDRHHHFKFAGVPVILVFQFQTHLSEVFSMLFDRDWGFANHMSTFPAGSMLSFASEVNWRETKGMECRKGPCSFPFASCASEHHPRCFFTPAAVPSHRRCCIQCAVFRTATESASFHTPLSPLRTSTSCLELPPPRSAFQPHSVPLTSPEAPAPAQRGPFFWDLSFCSSGSLNSRF